MIELDLDHIEVRGARENNLPPMRSWLLRLIYSRIGEPHVGHSSLFSFNDPQGMCPRCEAMGRVSTVDVDAMVDRSLSLNEGAITLPNFGVDSWGWRLGHRHRPGGRPRRRQRRVRRSAARTPRRGSDTDRTAPQGASRGRAA